MVHLRTVPDAFHARVIAARLGADGILTELRGAVGGPYPIGDGVGLGRAEDDSRSPSELLLADEVEAAFDDARTGRERTRPPARRCSAWSVTPAAGR